MNIDMTNDQAKDVIAQQLKDFAERAEAAYQLFIKDKPQDAYKMIPYEHSALGNLETYCSELAKP